MKAAIDAKKLATVITTTSRFRTWVISWPRTASSSAGSSSWRIPVVAHTVALLGERPIANAFGIAVWAIATRGLGRLAWMHRRSTIACSVRASGPSFGPDLAGAHRVQRDLVGGEQLDAEQGGGDDRDRHRAGAGRDQRGDEDGVDQAEQEDREKHPSLEACVAAEGGGTGHSALILGRSG